MLKKPLRKDAITPSRPHTADFFADFLNTEQLAAVKAPFTPLLIVAGAGTGKTRTLMSRLLYLIKNGADPSRICAITFTNKAAREMAERVYKFKNLKVDKPPGMHLPAHQLKNLQIDSGPFIGTFHALGARILRREARALGRTPHFTIFDDGDTLRVIKKILKTRGALSTSRAQGPARYSRAISKLKSSSLAHSADHEQNREAHAERLTREVYELYEQALRDMNAFDFDDLIHKPATLMKERDDVRNRYARMYSHVLIDEYQDLNNMQYEFVKLLAAHAESLTAVGDDAQMIYGWRGSNIHIFLNFEHDWPDTQTAFLEENYRSTGHVLLAANSVIRMNTLQSASRATKELRTKNPLGEKVRVVETGDEIEEAEWIVRDIMERAAQHTTHTTHHEQKNNGQLAPSVAILYRTNAQSRAIEQALIEADIPYRIYGGLKFYERREIKDLVAALRLASNPKDLMSKERLEKTFTRTALKSLYGALSALNQGENGASEIEPLHALNACINAINYTDYLEKNFANATERQENVRALADFASGFSQLSEFLERISLLESHDEPRDDEERARVNLMTIHLAKGLEFDSVYLAGASEGLLPHARSLDTNEQFEEERRLMYVAMTRAARALAITFYDIPSRFLADLPLEACEFLNTENISERTLDDEERYITLD